MVVMVIKGGHTSIPVWSVHAVLHKPLFGLENCLTCMEITLLIIIIITQLFF